MKKEETEFSEEFLKEYEEYCEQNPLIGKVEFLSKQEIIDRYGYFLTEEQKKELTNGK